MATDALPVSATLDDVIKLRHSVTASDVRDSAEWFEFVTFIIIGFKSFKLTMVC